MRCGWGLTGTNTTGAGNPNTNLTLGPAFASVEEAKKNKIAIITANSILFSDLIVLIIEILFIVFC